MGLRKLSQGERIVLVGGLLLIVDLLLVPWHSVDLGGLDIAAGAGAHVAMHVQRDRGRRG